MQDELNSPRNNPTKVLMLDRTCDMLHSIQALFSDLPIQCSQNVFVPRSDIMVLGRPRCPTNRRKTIMKKLVDSALTSSRCTHRKSALVNTLSPDFSPCVPHKSTPVKSNGLAYYTCCEGLDPGTATHFFCLNLLQMTHNPHFF